MKNVSIIIPHYNSPDDLKKLLCSIPVQDDIQVIVVDDRSTDEKYDVVEFQTLFPHVLFLNNDRENKGAGTARNIGLEHATGKWLLFADSDDYFMPNFYDIIKPFFDSDSDIIFFDPTSIELDTGHISDRHISYHNLISNYQNDPNETNTQRLRCNFYVPWSKLVRRSLTTKHYINFSETMVSNDLMFSTQIGVKANRFEVSKNCIYCVTKSKGSLTTTVNASHIETRIDVFIQRYCYLKEQLSASQLRILRIHGKGFLLKIIHDQLGFGLLVRATWKFIVHKVPIILLQDISIKAVPRRIKRIVAFKTH